MNSYHTLLIIEDMKYDIVTLDPDLEQAQQGGRVSLHVVGSYIIIYPAMTAFTNQYSLPNNFFEIGQL